MMWFCRSWTRRYRRQCVLALVGMVRRLGDAGLGRREASPFAVVSCSAYDSSAGIEEIEHSRAVVESK